jgi:hypothetical protein
MAGAMLPVETANAWNDPNATPFPFWQAAFAYIAKARRAARTSVTIFANMDEAAGRRLSFSFGSPLPFEPGCSDVFSKLSNAIPAFRLKLAAQEDSCKFSPPIFESRKGLKKYSSNHI